MSRFTTIKTAADHGLSEIFARNLQLDENTRSEVSQAGPSSKVQTAVQVSHTGDNRGYQKKAQLQEANDPLNAVDKTIQHVFPISSHATLLRPKARRRITAYSRLPRAIYQQRHKQYHRRYYRRSEKLLRCYYAPWAPATTMTCVLCALLQHLTPPPPCVTNTMTPFGLKKRRRVYVDWYENMAGEAGGLDTILEEEADF